MADKKSIVIKVKYPAPGRQAGENLSATEMITEWNVKRIVLAFGIIILLVFLWAYFYFSGLQQENSQQPVGVTEKIVRTDLDQDDVAESEKVPEAKATSSQRNQDAALEQPLAIKQDSVNKAVPASEKTKLVEGAAKQQAAVDVRETVNKQPTTVKNKGGIKYRTDNRVIRSLLAYKMINKEPAQTIHSPVKVSKAKSVQVNYFTELKGLNKKIIFHEWIKKGKVVSRQRLKVSADKWRTFSSRLFNHTAVGMWHVRTVDEKGHLLDEKELNIILE